MAQAATKGAKGATAATAAPAAATAAPATTAAPAAAYVGATHANYTHVVFTGITPPGKMAGNTLACAHAYANTPAGQALGAVPPVPGAVWPKAAWQGFANALPTLGAAMGWPAANKGHAMGSSTLGSAKQLGSVRAAYRGAAIKGGLPFALATLA